MSDKRPRFVTPKGILTYPIFISRPDNKYPTPGAPDGHYKVRLVLDREEADLLIEQLQTIFDAWIDSCKATTGKRVIKVGEDALPWGPERDHTTGEETDRTVFRFKLAATVEHQGGRFTQRPAVFGPDRSPLPDSISVGIGSNARVAGAVNTWYNPAKGAGMTLWFDAVQIIDLVEYKREVSPEALGFDEEDGSGFDNLNTDVEEDVADDF